MSDFTLTQRKEGASYDILSHLLFQQIPPTKAKPTLQHITALFGLEMTSRGPLVQSPAQSRSAMRPEQVSPDFNHSGLENLPGMEAEQPPWRILFRCQSTGTKPRLFQCVSRPAPADYSWKSAICLWNPWRRRIFKCLSYCQQPPWVGSHRASPYRDRVQSWQWNILLPTHKSHTFCFCFRYLQYISHVTVQLLWYISALL